MDGVIDVRVKCYRPMSGQVRIAQARRVLRESPQKLGSPQSSSKLWLARGTGKHFRATSAGVEGAPKGSSKKADISLPQIEDIFRYRVPGERRSNF